MEEDRSLVRKSSQDYLLSILKASLNSVPIVGGAIASLLGDYLQLETNKSIELFFKNLGKRLKLLEDRIDAEGINKKEFTELFKNCYMIIVRTHQESKLNAAAALVANILLKNSDREKLNFDELDHFTRCVENLSIGAIGVLGKARELVPEEPNKIYLGVSTASFTFGDLREKTQKESSFLMGLVGELNSVNLLHVVGIPSVRTPEYANYQIELTPLGKRFIYYLLKEI